MHTEFNPNGIGSAGGIQPSAPSSSAPAPDSTYGTAPVAGVQEATGWQDSQGNMGGYIPQGQPGTQHQAAQGQQAQQQPTVVQQASMPSPMSLAWSDIIGTPSLGASLSFKSLINLVPILNFCFYGMAGTWGRSPLDGDVSPMPKSFINGDTFKKGFFYMVICLVASLALGLCGAIIPFLGWIAVVAGSFFLPMIMNLMFFRYLSYGTFGDAWNLSDVWEKAKRDMSGLWTASFLPIFIPQVIASTVVGIVILVCVFAGTFQLALRIPGAMVWLGSGFLISAIILAVSSAIGYLWSFRATGYWLAMHVPEWNIGIASAQRMAEQEAKMQQEGWEYAKYEAQVAARQQAYQNSPVQPEQSAGGEQSWQDGYVAPEQAPDVVSPTQPVQPAQSAQPVQPAQSTPVQPAAPISWVVTLPKTDDDDEQ